MYGVVFVHGYFAIDYYLFIIFDQNLTAVQTAYADKLKKLKEASRSGATPSLATRLQVSTFLLNWKYFSLSILFRSQDASSKSLYIFDVAEQKILLTESTNPSS